MDGRKRTVQIKFRVTEAERDLILEKMKLVPTLLLTLKILIKPESTEGVDSNQTTAMKNGEDRK